MSIWLPEPCMYISIKWLLSLVNSSNASAYPLLITPLARCMHRTLYVSWNCYKWCHISWHWISGIWLPIVVSLPHETFIVVKPLKRSSIWIHVRTTSPQTVWCFQYYQTFDWFCFSCLFLKEWCLWILQVPGWKFFSYLI